MTYFFIHFHSVTYSFLKLIRKTLSSSHSLITEKKLGRGVGLKYLDKQIKNLRQINRFIFFVHAIIILNNDSSLVFIKETI